MLDKIDKQQLSEIQERHSQSRAHPAKYADVERWLKTNIERVQDLKLNRSRFAIRDPRIASAGATRTAGGSLGQVDKASKRLGRERPQPIEILDLGCGGGFFLFINQQLGHRCLGLDTGEVPIFTDLVDLLHVERTIWKIKAGEPLPDLNRKFDWITAFSVGFNRNLDKSLWGIPEWEFFLNDLQNRHLRPGGNIFLGLNPQHDGWFYTDELRNFFVRRGAMVERERIFFKR